MPMTEKNLPVALIGAGAIAQTWAAALGADPATRLAAVADLNLTAAHALAHRHGARVFSDCRALLASACARAAIIATPPATHAEIAIACADAGVHVLCEKPLAIRVADALRMTEAARRAGVLLSMASKFRFVPDVEQALRWTEDGVLGELQLWENAFTGRTDMGQRWNCRPEVSGGGVLIDNGTHSLDLARHFLGPLASILVVVGPRPQGLRVEETVHLSLRSARGVAGSVDLSWSLHKDTGGFMSLYGARADLVVGWRSSRIKHHGEKSWTSFGAG